MENFGRANVPIGAGRDEARRRVSDLWLDDEHDVAIGRLDNLADVTPLDIASKSPGGNDDVVVFEYSRARRFPTRRSPLGYGYRLEPRTRKGNVVAVYDDDQAPFTTMLELPFPALKGSSGAPVMAENDGSVVGMVVDNVDAELTPGQVLRREEAGRLVQEVRYLLPTGRAISWKHLRGAIEKRAAGGGTQVGLNLD